MEGDSDETSFANITATANETIVGNSTGDGYCGGDLKEFGNFYRNIHGYASLIVCLFGALANILNLVVLTRREMINPTNAILTGLALADLLNMVEYIPFTIYMYFLTDAKGGQRKTYGWAMFVLMHSNFSQVCHTISIWLTVTLAVWRYIMVAMPLKCKTLCSMERAKWAIASAYITSPLLCIPIYLTFSIREIFPPTTATPTEATILPVADVDLMSSTTPAPANPMYIVHMSDLAKSNPFLNAANFWLYSVVIKIIPCILLTVVSLRLINSLMAAKKRKEKLLTKRHAQMGNNAMSPTPGNNNRPGHTTHHESSGGDRTTRMLLAVLLLFLITEFPQGLLALLTGLLGDAFFKSCYIPLADLMDFMALLNSAINFILYCSMSKKFRDTFSQVFYLNQLRKLGRQWGRQRGEGGRSINRPKRRSSSNRHSSSPTTTTQLLDDHKEQTAV